MYDWFLEPTAALYYFQNGLASIAFFTRLKLFDENGHCIRPVFYSDNFFSLLPGESKQVTIEVLASSYKGKHPRLIAEAWNSSAVAKQLNK